MPQRSLKLKKEYQKQANNAAISLGLSRSAIATRLSCSNQPVSHFFNCKAVSIELFVEICKILKLDWQEITGISNSSVSNNNSSDLEESDRPPAISIDDLVTQLRNSVKADIENRCGTMRIFDMSQPIGLGKIFTQVNILEKVSARSRKDIAELIRGCRLEDLERFNLGGVVEEKIEGEVAVKRHKKLLILGKPGAGKTTFLKHLAIQCSRGKFKGDLIPWFVTLKDFAEADGKPRLLDYLGFALSEDPPQSPLERGKLDIVASVMAEGRALILLDGLDEVLEEDSKRVIREIEALTNKYPHNQYVLTCRIAAREYTFEKFSEVEIADFDDEQIATFAHNWFKQKPVKPETFLSRLENEPPIKELVSNPLLLTLLCISFEELGDFPANRNELYREGINALLRKWDSTRGIQRDKVYKPLSIAKKENLLSRIAWKTFAPGDYFFKTERAKRYISEYIRNLPGANLDDEALQGDSGVVLSNIVAQHGLLTIRAKNIYSFSHLTFQEYFTAREIILVRQSSNEALQELVEHIFDKRWREVFLLAVSMSPNAEKLVLLIKDKIDRLLATDEELQKYLRWLKRKSEKANIEFSESDSQTVQKEYEFYVNQDLVLSRVFYLGLDLSFNLYLNLNLYRNLYQNLNLNLNLYRNLDLYRNLNLYRNLDRNLDLYLALDRNLDFDLYFDFYLNRNLELAEAEDPQLYVALLELKQRLPDEESTSSEEFKQWWQANGRGWSADFRQAMIDHQDIGHDWQFSKEQKALLEQYYFANQLLTQCLHQDCYVRPEVRQEIEATLLLPYADVAKRRI